jgi:hypothetical protein
VTAPVQPGAARVVLFERGVGLFEFSNPLLHVERFRRLAACDARLFCTCARQKTLDILADRAQNLAHAILELQMHEYRFDLLADALAAFGHVLRRIAESLHDAAETFQYAAMVASELAISDSFWRDI